MSKYIRLYLWCIRYCYEAVVSIFWSHPNDLSYSQKHTFCDTMENTTNTTKPNITTCQYFESLTPIILPYCTDYFLKMQTITLLYRFVMHKVIYFRLTENTSKKQPSNYNHIGSIVEYGSLSWDNIKPFPCEY